MRRESQKSTSKMTNDYFVIVEGKTMKRISLPWMEKMRDLMLRDDYDNQEIIDEMFDYGEREEERIAEEFAKGLICPCCDKVINKDDDCVLTDEGQPAHHHCVVV